MREVALERTGLGGSIEGWGIEGGSGGGGGFLGVASNWEESLGPVHLLGVDYSHVRAAPLALPNASGKRVSLQGGRRRN